MSSIVTSLPPLELNHLTAGPLLRLLMAQRGMEDPELEPKLAWETFKLYCRLPAKAASDVVSFQATWTPDDLEEAPDPPIFYCTWSREISDDAEFDPVTRAIQIQWSFDPPSSDLEDVEIWSDSFADLDTFFHQIEETPQFQALINSDGLADMFTVDLHQ